LAKGCDLLILPTTPDVVSLEPMLAIANDVEDARYRALLTIVPPYPSKEGETMRNELIANGVPTFQSMIRRSAAFQKAALAGKPVNQMSGRDRIPWNDFEALGKEMIEVLRQ
ncbi:ParA family protein, partial [Picosynechococcus sp. PCC 7002]|uniref:ParA family protein n=2 Tax=Cyanobacteriota TaxID=1117 RepID=UPI0034D95FA8